MEVFFRQILVRYVLPDGRVVFAPKHATPQNLMKIANTPPPKHTRPSQSYPKKHPNR